MAKSTAVGDYTIDHDGFDGRWRAWWLRPDGYTESREFGTRREALNWAWAMAALEVTAGE
jgi:hypothetical protein